MWGCRVNLTVTGGAKSAGKTWLCGTAYLAILFLGHLHGSHEGKPASHLTALFGLVYKVFTNGQETPMDMPRMRHFSCLGLQTARSSASANPLVLLAGTLVLSLALGSW